MGVNTEGGGRRSPIATQLQCIAATDGSILAGRRLVVAVTLALTPALLARGSETSCLAVLVDRVDDPVDAGVSSNGVVRWVDGNDLKVLVHTVLVDPVAVQDSQVSALLAHSLLGNATQTPLVLEVVHTVVDGLAVCCTLGDVLLAVTTSNSDSVDDESLLGSVRWKWGPVRSRSLTTATDRRSSPVP